MFRPKRPKPLGKPLILCGKRGHRQVRLTYALAQPHIRQPIDEMLRPEEDALAVLQQFA